MANAVDKATGQVIQVPDSQLAADWKAGKIDLVKGAKYQFRSKDGTPLIAPAEHAADLLGSGADFISPEEAQAQHAKAAFAGEEGRDLAFSSGAIGQFTGGLSDQAMLAAAKALEASGARKPGYAKAFEQAESTAQGEHPIATGVGEGIGAAGLAAALPGGGLAGVGERGALALTEGLGETAAGRIAQRGIVGAAEGSLAGTQYGVAKTVSDDAFADHHLTAAHVIDTIGANTLWGGALGSGFGLAGALGSEFVAPRIKSAIGPTLDTMLNRGAPKADDVEQLVANNYGVDAAPGLGDQVLGHLKKMWVKLGHDPETIDKFTAAAIDPEKFQAEARAIAGTTDAARDVHAREFKDSLDTFIHESKPFASPDGLELKRGYVRSAVADMDDAAKVKAGQAAIEMADSVGRKIDGMVHPTPIKNADGFAVGETGGPEMYGDPAGLKKLAKSSADHQKRITELVNSGNIADAYLELDQWKRAIGKPKAALEQGLARGNVGTQEFDIAQARARNQMYGVIHDELRNGMESTDAWGRLGEQQHSVNSLWHQQIAYSKEFKNALTTRFGIDPDNAWLKDVVLDPGKAEGYLKNLTSPSKDLTHKAVMGYIDNTVALAKAVLERGELPPEAVSNIEKTIAAAERTKATLSKTADLLTAQNEFAKLFQGTDNAMGLGAAVAGTLITHGPIGGLAGLFLSKAARTAMNPGKTIQHLATITKWARQSDSKIARTLVDFAGGKARARVPMDSGSYFRKSAQVAEAMANPDRLAERIGQNVGDLRTRAPRLADAMIGATLSGIQFLSSKLPEQPPADPFEPNRKPPPPPIGERETWMRYYTAVQNPLTVLDDLRDGRLNMEGAEVLRDVYPPLFQRVRQQAFDLMAGGEMANLTKQQRIGLSLALDIPVPELDPAYVAARQAAFTQQPGAQQSAPAGGGKPKRSKAINITKNAPTLTTDRIESGAASRS